HYPDLTKNITVSFDSTIPDTTIYCKTGFNESYDTLYITRIFTVTGTKKIKADIQVINGMFKPFYYSFSVNDKKPSLTFDSIPIDHRIKPDQPDTMIFSAATDISGSGIEFTVTSNPVLDSSSLKIVDLGLKAMVITTAPIDTTYTISVKAQSGTAVKVADVKLISLGTPVFNPWKLDTITINAIKGKTLKVSLVPYLTDTTITTIKLIADKGSITGKLFECLIPIESSTKDSFFITAVKDNDSSKIKIHLIISMEDTSKPEKLKVTYFGNGNTAGKVPLDTSTYSKGSNASVIGNIDTLTKGGFVFTGWNTKSDGSGIQYFGGESILMDTSDINLYAHWSSIVLEITNNPKDIVADAGDTIVFSVSASEIPGATLLYQWQKNNKNIAGANNADLQISGVTKSDSGTVYRCIISTNNGGSASSTIARLNVTSVKAVWSSLYHTLILKTDGTLFATGKNSDGQLGDKTNTDRSIPVQIMKDVQVASSCGVHTMILKTDGTLWATGSNSSGQLGNSDTVNVSTPVQIMSNVTQVSAGGYHTMIIKTDGSLWATGRNSDGQLGNSSTINVSTPVQIMSDVKTVCAGGIQTMIIKNDGTLWVTGNNQYGQLGDSTKTSRSTPKKIMSDVKAVSNKGAHTLILKTDGTLWATGYNYYGGLGDGTTNSTSIPILVMSDVSAVWAGSSHTMILKTDRTLWAVGQNSEGQLGDGTKTSKITPIKIMSDVDAASPARTHTMIIKTDGTLWASGDNLYGQLGDGTIESLRTSPVQIKCK
ncbi:MAG TPA: InlB B-repeat-containing protein, partial [Chitinispirillaceae bacterium]|nr:InlB B-repeat-containing protein [Chitinispirillaceae bacterium]